MNNTLKRPTKGLRGKEGGLKKLTVIWQEARKEGGPAAATTVGAKRAASVEP